MEIELSYRANVMTRRYVDIYNNVDKTIVIYDDHRWILNVLFYLRAKNYFEGQTPNIIYFDKHDDAAPIRESVIDYFKRRETIVEPITDRDFGSIVEFDLHPDDADWVTTGMEFGLIKDVVCIGSEYKDYISKWEDNIYKTYNGINHKGFCISHLNSELCDQGVIGDSMIKQPYYKEVRDIFGYKSENNIQNPENPYILDFDLDCFTSVCMDKIIAWPEEIFKREYVKSYKTQYFVKNIISNASIITICREPGCCGGIGESNKILEYLDEYFFKGALGTKPIV